MDVVPKGPRSSADPTCARLGSSGPKGHKDPSITNALLFLLLILDPTRWTEAGTCVSWTPIRCAVRRVTLKSKVNLHLDILKSKVHLQFHIPCCPRYIYSYIYCSPRFIYNFICIPCCSRYIYGYIYWSPRVMCMSVWIATAVPMQPKANHTAI